MSKVSKKGNQSGKKVSKIEEDESLSGTLTSFWNKYSCQTGGKDKLIDWFIFYLISVIGVQFFYRLVVGDDFPKNAFLTGIFCPLGVIILLISIRNGEKNYRTLAQFFLACLVLFVVSINFVG